MEQADVALLSAGMQPEDAALSSRDRQRRTEAAPSPPCCFLPPCCRRLCPAHLLPFSRRLSALSSQVGLPECRLCCLLSSCAVFAPRLSCRRPLLLRWAPSSSSFSAILTPVISPPSFPSLPTSLLSSRRSSRRRTFNPLSPQQLSFAVSPSSPQSPRGAASIRQSQAAADTATRGTERQGSAGTEGHRQHGQGDGGLAAAAAAEIPPAAAAAAGRRREARRRQRSSSSRQPCRGCRTGRSQATAC